MLEWQTLEHGIEVASLDGLPLLVIVPTVEKKADNGETWRGEVVSIEIAKETIEGETGWRVTTKTIAGIQDPRGWTLAVTWAGHLAVPMTYAEWKTAPRSMYSRGPDSVGDICDCVGLHAYSGADQITAEWMGHPRGTWVVWSSRGVCGFARQVGVERVLMALVQEVRP